MNSFATYLSYLPKKIMAFMAAISAAVLVAAGASAAFGPERTIKTYLGDGTSGFTYVTFNSFTDVPNIGDERDFLRGKLNGTSDAYADPVSGLKDGDQVKVLVYVHNGADPSLNANGEGVAKDLKVRIAMPNGTATSQDLTGYISASNANPAEIYDTLTLNGDDAFKVNFVSGSARINTASMTDVALSDDIVNGGVLIGDDALDGEMNGCFEYYAYVTFLVEIEIEEEPTPEPIYECSSLTALPTSVKVGETVKFTATAKAENGATISKYAFAYGDGETTDVTTSATTANAEHAYDTKGEYTAQVTVSFDVDGQTKTDTNDQCKVKVTVTEDEKPPVEPPEKPPVTPPEQLPDTGIGSALAGFFGTSALFASARNWFTSRKLVRSALRGES